MHECIYKYKSFLKVNIIKVAVMVLFICIESALSQLSRNREELLNWCLKSKNHKHKPGKEDTLHKQVCNFFHYISIETD